MKFYWTPFSAGWHYDEIDVVFLLKLQYFLMGNAFSNFDHNFYFTVLQNFIDKALQVSLSSRKHPLFNRFHHIGSYRINIRILCGFAGTHLSDQVFIQAIVVNTLDQLMLHHVQDIYLCFELFRKFHGLAQRLFRIFGEVNGNKDASGSRHEKTPFVVAELILAGIFSNLDAPEISMLWAGESPDAGIPGLDTYRSLSRS